MASKRALIALLVVAGTSFWLATASPRDVLGLDLGNLGVAVLLAAVWGSLWLLSRTPPAAVDGVASPAEWQAWIGLVFLGFVIAYLLAKLPLFAVTGPIFEHPDAARAGRNGVMLLVSWFVVSSVLGRRSDEVEVDERDRQLAARGCAWARGFTVAALFVLAATLAMSPADRLGWATPLLLAQVMILIAMVSHWLELAVQAASYWRDRH